VSFEHQRVVVAGGTSGIGRATARMFAQMGANVLILGRNQSAAKAVIESSSESSGSISYELLDLTNAEDVKHIFAKNPIAKDCNILVNSTGITNDKLLLQMSESDWDDVLKTNLKPMYLCSKFALKSMLLKRKGTIINLSSVSGIIGVTGQTNYATTKAGVIAFTKSLAKEMGGKGIRVNCVAPGYIHTSMIDDMPNEYLERVLMHIPMKKMGTPEDVAKAILFLASDDASYITGVTLPISGGMVS
jgi:3-oxoacyl-[acyl-carrier protein] reductase